MYNWESLETRTEAKYVLDLLAEKIKNLKILRIFVSEDPILKKDNNIYSCTTIEQPLYILFENNYCMKIELCFPCALYIEYREITKEELNNSISSVNNKEIDLINGHHEVYSWLFDENKNRIEDSFGVRHVYDIDGTYGSIESFDINSFNHEYDKWISDGSGSDIITIPAGGDYFDEITMNLSNGISITIQAQDADSDGYYNLILEDHNNNINYNLTEK